MTIREIAKLAGVSPSTVSKILNNKDKHISSDTRSRVLEVVAHYQYSPLAKAMERSELHSRLVGLLVPSVADFYSANILRNFEKELSKQGYNLVVCNTDGDVETENNAMYLLRARRVECVVVISDSLSPSLNDLLVQSGIPFIRLTTMGDSKDAINIAFDYKKAIEMLMQCFFSNKHRKIALVISRSQRHIKQYYREETEERQQIFDGSLVFELSDEVAEVNEVLNVILKTGCRAILAGNMSIADELSKAALMRHLSLGQDLSLAAIDDRDSSFASSSALTCVKLPFDEHARVAVDAVLALIEGRKVQNETCPVGVLFSPGESVVENSEGVKPRIAVVGTINMDVMLEVSHLPNAGETIIITDKTILPGGKGANQAVGVAKLGAEVGMIGRLGNDLYGKELFHNLHSANVNVAGVVFDSKHQTGRAYIYVTDHADYSIGVHAGANAGLDRMQVMNYADMIKQASYCLVQTEIPMETVEYIGQLCVENNIKMILKPSPAKVLSNQLLRNIFMLVPNEVELNHLVSGSRSVEDKVGELLNRGVPRIVLTLGENGCYYADNEKEQYFEPMKVEVVDTAGASDAFISALAVYLAEGIQMERAIEYANIAAGISISRIGVQSALADRNTIEMKYKQKERSVAL